MTAKDKAKDLFDKFYFAKDEDGYHSMNKYRAKQCALIAVDEIIDSEPMEEFGCSDSGTEYRSTDEFWQEVKNELIK